MGADSGLSSLIINSPLAKDWQKSFEDGVDAQTSQKYWSECCTSALGERVGATNPGNVHLNGSFGKAHPAGSAHWTLNEGIWVYRSSYRLPPSVWRLTARSRNRGLPGIHNGIALAVCLSFLPPDLGIFSHIDAALASWNTFSRPLAL